MKKYPLALFIGRFQPFHKGHLYSLEKAREVGEIVMIGIGSSQESGTKDNPWSYQERAEMVRSQTKATIVGIPDYPQDSEWAEEIIRLVREAGYTTDRVVVVGNNSWTNDVLREAGMAVVESGLHNRDELEGVKIREMLRSGDEGWRERVPGEVIEMIG